jgi:hypothetical protein
MSRRRRIAFSVIAAVALLIGAAALWQDGQPSSRNARVLMLDPRTGTTLHQQLMDGGYAVVALLRGGRVAVATLDSCPDGRGGSLTVLDGTLQRVVSHRSLPPCTVARIDAAGLRADAGDNAGLPRPAEGRSGLTVAFGRGKLVEAIEPGGQWFDSLAAYDASGRLLWKRTSFGGHPGAVDVRDGRIAISVLGEFTPGSD